MKGKKFQRERERETERKKGDETRARKKEDNQIKSKHTSHRIQQSYKNCCDFETIFTGNVKLEYLRLKYI